jgi:hypothetical protein
MNMEVTLNLGIKFKPDELTTTHGSHCEKS